MPSYAYALHGWIIYKPESVDFIYNDYNLKALYHKSSRILRLSYNNIIIYMAKLGVI